MKTNKPSKSKCPFGLSSFDLVDKKFSFEFPTPSRKLQTKVGGSLTLIIVLVTVIATIMIGSQYFDMSSPSISFSNEIGPEVIHNLAQELLVPPVTVYMDGAPIQADFSRFATIKAIASGSSFNPSDGDSTKRLHYNVIDFVNCKELNDPYYKKLLSRIDDKNQFKDSLQCADFRGKYNLSDILVDHKNFIYKTFSIEVLPCSRKDPSECLPLASVSNLKVVVANAKKTVVPSNYTHPYQITVTMEEIKIDPFQIKYFQFESKLTKIVDFRNQFFGEEEKGQYLSNQIYLQDAFPRIGARTTCPNATGPALTRNCGEYIFLFFQGGSEVVRVKRIYNSPIQIIGEIGGVLKVALMLSMVYALYLKMKMKSFIINSVYSTKKEKEVEEKRAKILNKGQQEAGKKRVFGQTGRVRVAPRSQSRSTNDPKNSKKAKEECYKSATCFSNMQKNVNFFDLFERLCLNNHSKKMLSQAMLIRTMITKDPALQKRYSDYKKQFMNELDKKDQRNRMAAELGYQAGEEKDLAPEESDEKIKEGLKIFIQKQLGLKQRENFLNKKVEEIGQNLPHGAQSQAEFIFNIRREKSFGSKEALERKSRLEIELASDKQNNGSQSSQEGSPLRVPPARKNSEAFQLSAFGRRRRVASVHLGDKKSQAGMKFSSGKKILVKNKFGASRRQLNTDNIKKQK